MTSTNTFPLQHTCLVTGCDRLTSIRLLRPAADNPSAYVCVHHYFTIIHNAREHKMTEEQVQAMSTEQVQALVYDDPFREILAKVIADDKFKRIVKGAARRGKTK